MSTKIYNGYKLSITLDQLDRRMRVFRGSVIQAGRDRFNSYVAHVATDIIDRVALELPIDDSLRAHVRGETFSPLNLAYMHTHQQTVKAHRSGLRDPFYDFTCEVVVFVDRGQLFAMLFTEQRAFRDLWEALPWVAPFPYWDNSDLPADTSEKEWATRGKLWDRLLWNQDIPSLSGWTFTCYTTPPFTLGEISEHITSLVPGYQSRCVNFVKDFLLDTYRVALKSRTGLVFSEEAFTRWVQRNPKRKEFFEEKVKAALKKRLGKKDFKRCYPITALAGTANFAVAG